MRKPRTFTSRERLIEALVDEIYSSGKTFKQLADEGDLSAGTVQRLASGHTQWPRPKTLFGLIEVLRLEISLGRVKK